VLKRRGGSRRVVSRQPRRCCFLRTARADPPQKRPSFGVRSRQLDLCFIAFRRDGAMGLFLVLFWCAAVARDILPYNSRFGVFNSRLGPNKFPFPPRRELPGKGLICLTVPGADTALFGNNRKNSRFHGKSREFVATGKTGGDAACTRADLRCSRTAGGQPFARDGVPRTRPRPRRATGTASPPSHPIHYCTI
jgi:hypothetical protein